MCLSPIDGSLSFCLSPSLLLYLKMKEKNISLGEADQQQQKCKDGASAEPKAGDLR